VPPSFLQCLQYLQFLHALQGLAPLQVATVNLWVAVNVTGLEGAALNEMNDTKRIKSDFVITFLRTRSGWVPLPGEQ
jgi:hypothetical protein